jgi:hypothetical protein
MQGRRQEIREQSLFREDGCQIKPHQIKDNIPDDLETACYFCILFFKFNQKGNCGFKFSGGLLIRSRLEQRTTEITARWADRVEGS